MWDLHHCKNAVTRVGEMTDRMNAVLTEARNAGALIIHSPSSCMDFYQGHPGRLKAMQAPTAKNLPEAIDQWCYIIPEEEKGVYPIDQSDGGEDDDPIEHAAWADYLESIGRNPRAPWIRQVEALEIHPSDAITDDGKQVWNLLEQHHVKHVIVLGVHTNMCVLGRPFGLRQMAKNGKDVVLMRDMTDTIQPSNVALCGSLSRNRIDCGAHRKIRMFHHHLGGSAGRQAFSLQRGPSGPSGGR